MMNMGWSFSVSEAERVDAAAEAQRGWGRQQVMRERTESPQTKESGIAI
jgi:hypothetical protein